MTDSHRLASISVYRDFVIEHWQVTGNAGPLRGDSLTTAPQHRRFAWQRMWEARGDPDPVMDVPDDWREKLKEYQ